MPDPRGLLPTVRAGGLLLVARALRGRVRVDREVRLVRRMAACPLGRSRLAARTLAAHRRVYRLGAAFNCLDRSVALWTDLDAARHAATLRFGVRHGPHFQAHAWVELDGEPLEREDPHATFAPFEGDLGRRFAGLVSG